MIMKRLITAALTIVGLSACASPFIQTRYDTNTDAVAAAIVNSQSISNAQAVVATNIPQSSLYSSNSAQLGGNLPSYYAAASNVVATTVDSNGLYTVLGTNAPFSYPGSVGIATPIAAVYVTSGRAAYNNTWFTNANTTVPSWVSTVNAARYITNAIYTVGVGIPYSGFELGGGAGGPFPNGAATNSTLFGYYTNNTDATATNTFVIPYPTLASGFYLPNNTNAPPPLAAIPAGGCFIQCSNSEVWFIFNTNSTEVGIHFP